MSPAAPLTFGPSGPVPSGAGGTAVPFAPDAAHVATLHGRLATTHSALIGLARSTQEALRHAGLEPAPAPRTVVVGMASADVLQHHTVLTFRVRGRLIELRFEAGCAMLSGEHESAWVGVRLAHAGEVVRSYLLHLTGALATHDAQALQQALAQRTGDSLAAWVSDVLSP